MEKNSKKSSKIFWAEGLAGNWAENFFRRSIWAEFWPEIFEQGGPSSFFSKNRDFFIVPLLRQKHVGLLGTLNKIYRASL
jgi:hypothetical protein